MNGNGHDERLQDYLDGRMTDDKRRAFEDRLARDPDLAAAVDDARALGDSLRALDAPLPEGFHERARERFEASASPGRRVPWEALGLAAAALVVGAILVPWAMRTEFGEVDRVVTEPTEVQEEARTAPAAPEPAEERTGEPKLERVVADAASERDLRDDRITSEEFAPAPADPKETRAKKAAPPRPEAERKDDLGMAANEGFADEADDEDAGGRAGRARESYLESATTDAPRRQRAPAALAQSTAPAPSAAPLTADHVLDSGASATRPGRVPDADTWRRWVTGSGGDALAVLAPDRDWRSIAVIAGPADCGRVRIRPGVDDGVLVVVPSGPDAGCAIRLDDPAGPIRVVRETRP